MKKVTVLFIIILCATVAAIGQVRSPKLTVYRDFKPSTIRLTDGRAIRQSLTNIFLKNSSLLYMRGSVSMEANMDNIVSVKFDDREYFKIDTVLAYPVDSVGQDILYCATVMDLESYVNQLKNNQVITNLSLGGDQIATTTIDLSNDEDYKFPLINLYYFRYKGEIIKAHERHMLRKLPKDKRRILKTFCGMNDFSWTDETCLMKLLNALQ